MDHEVAVASAGLGVARTAGIAWFLPESHVEVVRPPAAASPEPPKARPHSGAAPTPSRRRRRHHHRRSAAAKDNDGVDVIDIEDEDHSFTSFFVGVGKSTGGGTNSSSSSEASEVKRPMVLFHSLGSRVKWKSVARVHHCVELIPVERPPASLLFV